eukprot:NODE_731_length_4728_cov_0.293368.p3 type:complete len:141 gc:universal NODE_731_length_4728_cov_0.293368:1690-2112(+)
MFVTVTTKVLFRVAVWRHSQTESFLLRAVHMHSSKTPFFMALNTSTSLFTNHASQIPSVFVNFLNSVDWLQIDIISKEHCGDKESTYNMTPFVLSGSFHRTALLFTKDTNRAAFRVKNAFTAKERTIADIRDAIAILVSS